jgi:hypothetical protein
MFSGTDGAKAVNAFDGVHLDANGYLITYSPGHYYGQCTRGQQHPTEQVAGRSEAVISS